MTLETKSTPEPLKTNSNSVPGCAETRVCKEHGEYTAVVIDVNRITGNPRYSHCPKCADAIHNAKKADAEKESKALIEKNRRNSGIPYRFRNAKISDYVPVVREAIQAKDACVNYAKNIESSLVTGASLVMCGKVGTGKTHLACAIGNHALSLSKTVCYTNTYRAVARVKDTYRKGSDISETQAIESFIGFDLLILDEIGIQYGSDAEKIILYQIINGRHEAMKATIAISNLTSDELMGYIGEPCLDRLSGGDGGIITFTWGSYRQKPTTQK